MMEVRLRATSVDKNESETVMLQFDSSEIELIRLYLYNCDRLKNAQILKNKFPYIKKIEWTDKTGFIFEITHFEYSHLCELLHLARPFFLLKEPASFHKTKAIFGKKSKNKETALTKFLKYLGDTYEYGDYRPYFQFTMDDIDPFHEKTIICWLNGIEYHQDIQKALIIRKLEMSLQPNIVRGIFTAQLSGRIRAIFELANLANIVVKNERI